MSETREKRARQLTVKGQTMFDEHQEQEKGENIWIKIEDIMITVPSSHQLDNIRQLNTDIDAYYKNFIPTHSTHVNTSCQPLNKSSYIGHMVLF